MSSYPLYDFARKRGKLLLDITNLLKISPLFLDYVTMQGHISKPSYTRKQRKEFLRIWTAIGRAHVSASHGPDLFQLLDIASSSLVADHDCDDCKSLYTAHPSPAGSPLELSHPPNALAEAHLRMAATDQQITYRSISVVGSDQTLPVPAAGSPLCTPNSTAAISTSKRSGLQGKRQARFGQASELGGFQFGSFISAVPAPPLTGNTLFGFKPASNAAPAPPPIENTLFGFKPASDAALTYNAGSTSSAGCISKPS
jgi:hypothetical protein